MDNPAERSSQLDTDIKPMPPLALGMDDGDVRAASILDLLGVPANRSRIADSAGPAQLRDENDRLQGMLDAYQAALDRHAIVAVTDRRGRMLFVNPKFCSISGYSSFELLGRSHRIVNSGHHPKSFFLDMWHAIGKGEVWHGEICNRTKGGDLYWVDTTIVPLTDPQGQIEAYVSIRYDITKRKLAEEALTGEVEKRRQAETLLRDIIETVPDGIAAFDADDRLVLHNTAYRALFPQSKDAIRIGAEFESIVRHGIENGQYVLPRNSAAAREAWYKARLDEHTNPGKISVHSLSDGRWMQSHERRSTSGHIVGTRIDITELKRSEAAIKFHAEHDPLTSLFNRSVFEKQLSLAVETSLKTGAPGALIFLDLDGFKQVNDTMGHAAGDALLVAVARRLEETVRKSDTVVRLGGDEFAIVLPQLGNRDVNAFAEKLLAALGQTVTYQKYRIRPQGSLGICRYPDDGRQVSGLMKKADMALYQAKTIEGSAYRLYSRAMRSKDLHKRKRAVALAAAVETGGIDIALQPQFRLGDRSHSGFEALARWQHGGQAISPADFIPIAEENGLIVELGRQVLDKALQAIRKMKAMRLKPGPVAVNIAAEQLRKSDFPAMLFAMVAERNLMPADLELELTENILLDHEHERIAATLTQLRAMGFSIALDDFGTGYASLAHLGRFPVDKIKIDRSFVNGMLTRQDSLTIVRAVTGLAHSLGMQVVAEGIETEEQFAKLLEMNCDFGQGYLVSPPIAPAAVPAFLKRSADPKR